MNYIHPKALKRTAMKKIAVLFFVFLLAEISMAKKSDTTSAVSFEGMKTYYLGLLRKGNARTSNSTPELQKLQEAHLNHLTLPAKSGKLVMAGPLTDNGDVRGIMVFVTETLEEAKKLAEQDPAVKAGRLKVEIHPWFAKSGSMLP